MHGGEGRRWANVIASGFRDLDDAEDGGEVRTSPASEDGRECPDKSCVKKKKKTMLADQRACRDALYYLPLSLEGPSSLPVVGTFT